MKPAKSLSPEAEFRSRLSWFVGISDPKAIDPDALTYEPYFGLREKPFSLAADPRFFFTESGHGIAFNTLAAGIKRREGILVLTGEVGAGKTTLCRAVLQSLDRKTFAAFVSDPFLSREDLLKTLLIDFGVVSADDVRRGILRGASRVDLSYPLFEFLGSLVPLKAFAVAMIDEAQNLTTDLLEEIRILSDLERDGQKLVQVFLVGQPELEARLAAPAMRQLAQRVTIRCELPPLTVDELGLYVAHRLAVAGNDGRVRFTDAAITELHALSGGVPRVVNLLCDHAMARAASLQTFVVDAEAAAAAPGLALVHNEPTRVPLRDIPAAPPPHENEVPVAPDSLVNILSGFTSEADAKAAAETPPAHRPTTAPEAALPQSLRAGYSPATVPTQTWGARPWLAVAVAAVVALLAWTVYRSWPATSGGATTAQQPVVQPSPTPAPPADAPKTVEPAATTPPAPPQTAVAPPTRVAILVATFVTEERTAKSLQELREAGLTPFSLEVALRDGGRGLAVYVGPYDDRATAERELDRTRQLPGYEGARIVSIKPTVHP